MNRHGIQMKRSAPGTRRRIWRMLISLVIGLSGGCAYLAGCGDGPTACTADFRPGVSIKILDSETGLPAACDAEAWLISGSYSENISDSWRCSQPDSLQSPWLNGAHERPGIYTAIVLKDGYVPWFRSGVRVFEDNCHVHEVKLEARLVPVQ